jgi:hypothetical protein
MKGNERHLKEAETPETLGRGSKLGTCKSFKQALSALIKRRKLRGRRFNPFGEKLSARRSE